MTKFEKLDAAIMAVIDGSPQPFGAIFSGAVMEECKKLAGETGIPFRFCDRRLQSLRKSGKIQFTGKGWVREEN